MSKYYRVLYLGMDDESLVWANGGSRQDALRFATRKIAGLTVRWKNPNATSLDRPDRVVGVSLESVENGPWRLLPNSRAELPSNIAQKLEERINDFDGLPPESHNEFD